MSYILNSGYFNYLNIPQLNLNPSLGDPYFQTEHRQPRPTFKAYKALRGCAFQLRLCPVSSFIRLYTNEIKANCGKCRMKMCVKRLF